LLLRQLEGAVIVAHNAPFDLGFLHFELRRAGVEPAPIPALDTLLLARRWYRFRSNALGAVAHELGVPTGRLHRAAEDVAVTWGVFARMRQRLEPLGMRTLAAWLAAQDSRPTLAAPGQRQRGGGSNRR
jgi:DNA polymerase III alpha subunit (gram-positive type)